MACTFEKIKYKGWDAVELKNELISLVAVPDIGGRVMAYRLGPYSYLYNDPSLAGKLFTAEENQGDGSLAAWKNSGGDKTWPSPQGWDNQDQWPGPPDPILDSGRYSSDAGTDGECAWVRMVSPAGSTTGIQITRSFTLRPGSTCVECDLTFTNISRRKVRWSIWDVAQLDSSRMTPGGLTFDSSCAVTTELNPESRFDQGFYVMFGDENNPQWTVDRARGLFVGKSLWQIGKVGIDTPCGWVAFSNLSRGCAFAERFAFEPDQEYPDRGATVECWTVGKGQVANLNYEGSDIYLMETEVLSPYYNFAPGESRSTTIQWGACACAGLVAGVTPAGCMVEPLTAEPAGSGYARVRGSFGVFDQGALWLSWRERSGAVVKASEERSVDPLSAVILDLNEKVPESAVAAVLEVKARASCETFLLAETAL